MFPVVAIAMPNSTVPRRPTLYLEHDCLIVVLFSVVRGEERGCKHFYRDPV